MIPLKDNIPTDRFPVVTVVLITLNLLVFSWQLLQPSDEASSPSLARAGISERDQASVEFGAIPFRITHPGSECGARSGRIVCGSNGIVEAGGTEGEPVPDNLDGPAWWLTVLTSMFMHAGFLHIAGNMLFLWVFGNNIEDSMGPARFLLFYLLSGVAAVYAQAALDPSSTGPVIGASGAVAGVLGAYILLHPKARVLSLVIIIFFVTLVEIPAMVLLTIWFLLQFVPAVGQLAVEEGGEGGVAYLAHVGGFVFGMAAVKLFAKRWREREDETPRLAGG